MVRNRAASPTSRLKLAVLESGNPVHTPPADNLVLPDARVAVVALTNQDSVDASGTIARKVAALLLRDADASRQEDQAREVFAGLQQGQINRALFTDNCNSYFTDEALKEWVGLDAGQIQRLHEAGVLV